MSHIPEAAMKHAKAVDDAPATEAADAKPTLGEKATEAADRAKDAVKSHPKTAVGIGAAVVAGIAAAVAAPAVIAKAKATPKKKAPARKTAKAK